MYKRFMMVMTGLLAANLFLTWMVPEAEAWRYYRSIESTHSWAVTCDPTTEFCPDSVSDKLFGVASVDGEYVPSCKMQGLVFCDPLNYNNQCPLTIDAAEQGETDFVSLEVDITGGSATTIAKLSTAKGQAICDYWFNDTVFDKFWPQDATDDYNVPDFFAHTTFTDSDGNTQVLQEECYKPENATNGEVVAECYGTTTPFKVPCCGGSSTLTVEIEGQGTVESSTGMYCDEGNTPCLETYDVDNPGSPVYDTCPEVTLTATPECDPLGSCYEFTGWSGGGCSGTDPSCTVASKGDPTVTASFEASYHTLTVKVVGDGAKDRVWLFDPRSDFDDPAEFYCYGICTKRFEPGATVTIKRKGGTFNQWGDIGDACEGVPNSADTCTIVMNGSKTATAKFIN